MEEIMIEYKPTDEQSEFMGYVMVDKILHLSKDGDDTVIHLVNGGELQSMDSMKTLQARINLSKK